MSSVNFAGEPSLLHVSPTNWPLWVVSLKYDPYAEPQFGIISEEIKTDKGTVEQSVGQRGHGQATKFRYLFAIIGRKHVNFLDRRHS